METNTLNISNTPKKIIIKNFGPIKKADIDIGDFTVIIGPNSSGKTFMIDSVYAISKKLSELLTSTISNLIFQAVNQVIVGDNEKYPVNITMANYPDDKIDNIVDYIIDNFDGIKENFHGKYKSVFYLNQPMLRQLKEQIFNYLLRYFQTTPDKLITFGSNNATINAFFDYANIEINIRNNNENNEYDINISLNRQFLKEYVKGFHTNLLGKGSGSYGSFPVISNIVLIPTERISILETIPNIIDELARGLRLLPDGSIHNNQEENNIKASIAEFISNYISSVQFNANKGYKISASGYNLIGGDLNLNKNIPLFISFKQDKNEIPFNLLSSGILQLIPIVLLAESNYHFILIEEPELNLHANKQVEVAEYLWKLTNENNKRIFVTTHSDYFSMKLAHLSKNNKNKSLKIYLLNNGVTKQLHIDENGELDEIETISNVINKLLSEI